MKEEHEKFDLIERYLQGKLEQEEHTRVEERIKQDPSFADEVKLSENVNSVVLGAAMDRLREQMTNDISNLDKVNKLKWWSGSFVLLVGISASIYWFNKNDSSKEKISSPVAVQQLSSSEKVLKSKPSIEKKITLKENTRNTGKINGKEEEIKREPEIINSVQEHHANHMQEPVQNITQETSSHTQTENQNYPNEINKSKPEKCNLTFHPVVSSTCKGEANGSIEISEENIKGGISPYVFVLDHDKESTNGDFPGLSGGKHNMSIKDKSGCSISLDIIITEKHCTKNKSFSINPDNGEIWKIPYSEGGAGKFTILNKAGIVIFRGFFGNNEISEWKGEDMHGTIVSAGLYVCVMEYSKGETETVQITIER